MTILETLKEALMITSFVMVIMLIIEYLNVQSNESWGQHLRKSSVLQVIFASVIGVVPGCIGGFTIASLYLHRFVNIGALVAVMIAVTGDESFVMFSTMPSVALKLNAILLPLAIVAGLAVNLIFKNKNFSPLTEKHFKIHREDHHEHKIHSGPRTHGIHISFERAALLLGLIIFIILLVVGEINFGYWTLESWEKITFLVISLVAVFIVATTSEHFLKEHLVEHVFKSHLIRIFLWTFGTLLFLLLIRDYFNLENWIQHNLLIILIFALIIGIIPQSGPHLVFITLFLEGMIPFSILLANSIVQDGHGSLILIAESRKSFLIGKGLCILIGAIAGLAGYFTGW
ncbi:MAG: arsenic efflux protein [Bacteroidia bacterium]|nr:arsenic efflux protein [Bacteroidia bacterium]